VAFPASGFTSLRAWSCGIRERGTYTLRVFKYLGSFGPVYAVSSAPIEVHVSE
jgi:hypothetical protein